MDRTTLEFEWDVHKATGNRDKHSVPFKEAVTVFDDPRFITFADAHHLAYDDRKRKF